MEQVSVDDDFARFGDKSYAINKITSVEVREIKPNSIGCAIAVALIAGASILFYLVSLADPGGGILGLLIFGLIAATLFYPLLKWSRRIEYQLFLITSAAETQAYKTSDADEVATLRARIEAAMVRQMRP